MSNTATTYLLANGATFSIKASSASSAITIGQLKSIAFSGSKLDLEDITNLDSPNSYREYAPTLLDAGNAQLDGVFNPADAGQIAAVAAFDARSLCTFQLTLPITGTQTTAATRTFTGYFSARPVYSVQADKTSAFTATIKITGAITDVAGA